MGLAHVSLTINDDDDDDISFIPKYSTLSFVSYLYLLSQAITQLTPSSLDVDKIDKITWGDQVD